MKRIALVLFSNLFLAALLSGAAWSNIWVDETFDDGAAFNAADRDTFDNTLPTTPPLSFSLLEGAITTDKTYNGTHSYKLLAGEGITVDATAYENPTNGPFQYFQFAASLGSIPATSGETLAEFRWNWTLDGDDFCFFVRWVSYASSKVKIYGGEDLSGDTLIAIDEFSSADDWRYITVQVNKNSTPAGETDSRTGQTMTQGCRFFSSSAIHKGFIPVSGVSMTSGSWSLTCSSGSFFIDDLYWEGGMTNGDQAQSNLRNFTGEVAPEYALKVLSAVPDRVYDSLLEPRSVGYLGSDDALSVPLSATQTSWFFGDTLIGRITGGGGRDSDYFLRNTIALHDLTTDAVEYYWDTIGGVTQSFFHPPGGDASLWYWPGTGFLHNGTLYIFCYALVSGGPFGFIIDHETLIEVANPLAPPALWAMNYIDLGLAGGSYTFISASYILDSWLYLYGGVNGAMSLARVPLSALESGLTRGDYEYWTTSGVWSATPTSLVPLMAPGVSESAIQYIDEWGIYLCTVYEVFGPEVYLYYAEELTGPWLGPIDLYSVPEHTWSPDYFSYAAKAHPELATSPDELIFTYAVNSLDFGDLFTSTDIYYPRFVRVQLQYEPALKIANWFFY